jgi:hypothetical protein
MKTPNGFNPATHVFKEFAVREVPHSRYNKLFNNQEELDKFVGANELLQVYHMNVLPGGKLDAVIDERKPIITFYNEVSRRYFVDNNKDYNIVEQTVYKGKPAVWVDPR